MILLIFSLAISLIPGGRTACEMTEYETVMVAAAGETSDRFRIEAYNVTNITATITDIFSPIVYPSSFSLRLFTDGDQTLYNQSSLDGCIKTNSTYTAATNVFYFTITCHNLLSTCVAKMAVAYAGCNRICNSSNTCGPNACDGVCGLCPAGGECTQDNTCSILSFSPSEVPTPPPIYTRSMSPSHSEESLNPLPNSSTTNSELTTAQVAGAAIGGVAGASAVASLLLYLFKINPANYWKLPKKETPLV